MDFNTTYPVEVSIRSCQFRKPLFTHMGNNKRVIRQQPFFFSDFRTFPHDFGRQIKNGKIHLENSDK